MTRRSFLGLFAAAPLAPLAAVAKPYDMARDPALGRAVAEAYAGALSGRSLDVPWTMLHRFMPTVPNARPDDKEPAVG